MNAPTPTLSLATQEDLDAIGAAQSPSGETKRAPANLASLFPRPVTLGYLLSQPAPPPVDFVFPGLPAGQLGILAGPDASGKSGIAMQIALSVASGLPTAGGILPAPAATGRVLYIMGEDDQDAVNRKMRLIRTHIISEAVANRPNEVDQVHARLEDAEGNLSFVCLNGQRRPLLKAARWASEPEETEFARGLIDLMRGFRLTVIDPMVMFHAVSESDNGHMDAFARLLIRSAQQDRKQAGAVLLLHHTSQEAMLNSRDDHQAGRGGTGLGSAARAIFVIRKMSAKERRATEVDARIGRIIRGPKISHGEERGRVAAIIHSDGVLWKADADTHEALEELQRKEDEKEMQMSGLEKKSSNQNKRATTDGMKRGTTTRILGDDEKLF